MIDLSDEAFLARLEYTINEEKKWRATADRRLELLKTCNAVMPACPFCGENLRVWDRLAYNERRIIGHKPDCELAKELND